MALTLAALAQLLLGAGLFWMGRWGRLGADALVPPRRDAAEHLKRADALARSALFCQGIGVLLVVFAVVTALAAINGVGPTLRPR